MSAYPPPQEFNPVFNESEYNTSSDGLTQASGDLRYLKLTGGVLSGITTFSAGLQTANIYNSGNTFSVPSSSGQLALVSQIPSLAGYVDTTTNQSINGIKTFSTNPIISAISNSGFDLSIPTITGADTIASLGLTQTITNKTLNLVAGAVGTPSLYFSTDTTSGLYRPSANQIGVSCSGAQVGNWTSTGLSLVGSGVISNTLGTVSLPSYTFTGNTNTGIYSSAADTIDFACGGVNRLSITSSLADFAGTVQILTIRGKGGSSNIVSVAPITNDAVGTSILRITPSTGSWSATGTATLQFGDLNHTATVVNGTAMTFNVPTEIRSSISGTQRLKVSATGINTTGIAQTSIPMACMMTKSTAQSTGSGSAVSVVSYNVSSNPSSYFTLSTGSGTITFTVSDAPCMIFVSGQIQFPSSIVGVREIWIEDGSGSRWVDFNRNATSDAGDTSKSAIAGMRMITTNATYVLTMKIYQNTGGTINSGGIVSTNLTTFCCARIN